MEKIKDGGYGIAADGKRLVSEVTIDLTVPRRGWNNTEASRTPRSRSTTCAVGHAGRVRQIATGWQLYLAEVNKAGITDSEGKSRNFNLIFKDDGYDAARTIPLVDELIDSEKVFTMITLGSPSDEDLRQAQRALHPLAIVMTGHPAWGRSGEPQWTTGEQMAYNTEAVLWGAFIEDHADELKAVGNKSASAAR
ncbi:MAG: hypothetical protein R2755_32965 [Acidimicrobiales bacterium]